MQRPQPLLRRPAAGAPLPVIRQAGQLRCVAFAPCLPHASCACTLGARSGEQPRWSGDHNVRKINADYLACAPVARPGSSGADSGQGGTPAGSCNTRYLPLSHWQFPLMSSTCSPGRFSLVWASRTSRCCTCTTCAQIGMVSCVRACASSPSR